MHYLVQLPVRVFNIQMCLDAESFMRLKLQEKKYKVF